MNKDLLRMDNLSKDEILDILNLADQLKYEQKHGIEHHLLKEKSLGMIFEKHQLVQEFPLKLECINLVDILYS